MDANCFQRRSVGELEFVHLDCTNVEFSKHAHYEYVIGANLIGRENIWLDGRNYEASLNEATLYNPGEVQASRSLGDEWRFHSLYVDVEFVRRAMGDDDVRFGTPVVSQARLASRIRGLCSSSLSYLLDDQEVVEATIALIGDLASVEFLVRAVAKAACSVVRRTAERLLDDPSCPPRLFELAAEVELTPVQLLRRFTAVHGLPPFAWLNVHRLKMARRMLAAGTGLSEVAHELGFSDQAHFTRRFKAMYSVTPGLWSRGT